MSYNAKMQAIAMANRPKKEMPKEETMASVKGASAAKKMPAQKRSLAGEVVKKASSFLSKGAAKMGGMAMKGGSKLGSYISKKTS